MSTSSYSVGNRVYNGGSSAPTRGTVDPTGYIDREANKMASNSRSGLAEAALRKLKTTSNPGQQQSQLQRTGTAGPSANPNGVSGRFNMMGGGSPMGAAPATPKPSVNLEGRIGAPRAPQSSGIGFDPDAAGAQQMLAGEDQRFRSEIDASEQSFLRDIMLAERDISNAKPQDQRDLLENYGARGMVYSSGYGYDQGQLESEYARMFSDLQSGKQNGLADLLRQRGLWSSEFANRLNAIQQAATRRAAEAARLDAERRAAEGAMGGAVPGGAAPGAPAPTGSTNFGNGTNPGQGAPVLGSMPGAIAPIAAVQQQNQANPYTPPAPAQFMAPNPTINQSWTPPPTPAPTPQPQNTQLVNNLNNMLNASTGQQPPRNVQAGPGAYSGPNLGGPFGTGKDHFGRPWRG